VEKGGFNIVHFHGTRAAMLGRMAAILTLHKPKIVYTVHGFHLIHSPNPLKRIPLLLVERLLNRFTDVIICVSHSDRKNLIQRKLAKEDKIKVIWNGIDIKRFQKVKVNRYIKKKEFNLPPDAFVITMIGRLHPQKDHQTLLTAFQQVASELPNAYLLIVGEGPLRAKLEQYTQSLGIEGRVKFTGLRRDIPAILAITDVFVLSTLWEGLPIVLLEAMAAAKPVIASDVDGNREVVVNEETGLLVPPGNPEALAQTIIRLAKEPQKAKEMGQKGLERAKRHFSMELMCQQIANLYTELAKSQGAT